MKTVNILLNVLVTAHASCPLYFVAIPDHKDLSKESCIPEYTLAGSAKGVVVEKGACPPGYMQIRNAKDCESAASAVTLFRAGDAYVHNYDPAALGQGCFRGGHIVSMGAQNPAYQASPVQICREEKCADNPSPAVLQHFKGGCSQLVKMQPDACQGDGVPAMCPSSCGMCDKQAGPLEEATMMGDAAVRDHKVFVGATGFMLGGIVVLAALKIRNSMRRKDDAYENLEA